MKRGKINMASQFTGASQVLEMNKKLCILLPHPYVSIDKSVFSVCTPGQLCVCKLTLLAVQKTMLLSDIKMDRHTKLQNLSRWFESPVVKGLNKWGHRFYRLWTSHAIDPPSLQHQQDPSLKNLIPLHGLRGVNCLASSGIGCIMNI